MKVLYIGIILIGLAIITLGVGVLGVSGMKGGEVGGIIDEIGITEGIGAGLLYGGGVVLFIGFLVGAFTAFGLFGL